MLRASLLSVALVSLAVGCKKPATVETTAAPPPAVSTPVTAAPSIPQEDLDALLGNFRRVNFEYDSYTLDETALAALKSNASILGRFPSVVVEVAGHCDERGTADYNLALGNRRADAVRTALLGFGVTSVQVRTISYGEEMPAVAGASESAWAENRRAEFRVLAK